MELNRLNKTLSAFEYFSKTKIWAKLQDEIEEIRVIEVKLKQTREDYYGEFSNLEKKINGFENEKKKNIQMSEGKGTLDQRFNEKQKQVIHIESEMKNMIKNLELLEKEQTSRETFRKQNQPKYAKLNQMIEFSNNTLIEYEELLKEKKTHYEEAKRNLQSTSGNNVEDANESLSKQIELAEKKLQDHQNHIHSLNQKIFQNKEQLEVEKSVFESSLNNR